MIGHPAFSVEPWSLRETELDTDVLAQTESLFALSNGHVGWRGNLDEGEPHGLAGSYLNGVYERHPLPYAEAGYGDPESGQTVINVTNGKVIRLLVDDEPFDVRYGDLHAHERVLDFRSGTLRRSAQWCSPTGRTVRVSSVRLVSLTQRAVAAVCFEVEPLDGPARVVVQSELVANEEPPPADGDPRAATVLRTPLRCEEHQARAGRALLVHATGASGLRVAAAMDHQLTCPEAAHEVTESREDLGRLTVATLLQPGQRLRLVKFVTYGWSANRSVPALRDQVEAALSEAVQTGWDGLLADQRGYLDDFWGRADVELDGDDEIQQAVRFGLFHILQAGARAEGRGIPAKGLTGPGYDGHAFWDTETFVLPVLTFALPAAAAHALRWRQAMLPLAIERARQLGLHGAAFPWRTIGGEECSGYWPAGTAAFHINADIADAAVRYIHVTGDADFEEKTGLDLLVHTARLWRSLGHYDSQDRFRIDGVTGPDEYTAVCDNNVYTNLMAQRNLAAAADAAERHPDRAGQLEVSADEAEGWRRAAAAMLIPYDDKLGVHAQAEGFTEHQAWDFAGTRVDQYPLLRHFPYFDLYRKQVVKQADLVLAMQLCPDAFSAEQKERNFAYYEAVTVRDSSLSAGTQAVIAAETGHLDLAYDYLAEAALMDLEDLEHNTRDGLHIAALAGSWIALVDGFGGLRNVDGSISFAPRLPPGLTRLAFTVSVRGRRLRAEVTQSSASYVLADDGSPIEIRHHDDPVTVTAGRPQPRPIPPSPVRPRPAQPPGREPRLGGRVASLRPDDSKQPDDNEQQGGRGR
jgi:alpha,alpha-trehalose phosphorylase